jgi:SAM-dependent methyltransferase
VKRVESVLFLRIAFMFFAACAGLSGSAWAAQQPPLDIPTPYLPSTTLAVEEMLRVADIKPNDVVVDLGSGDGRIPIAAARYFGARGFGVDIDAKLVAEANANARLAGVADRVQFFQRDIMATDVREATVVTLYLLPSLVNRVRPKLVAELRPGARIVAHDYGIEGWKPDRTVHVSKTYYLYIVPAAVGGKWRLATTLPQGERSYDLDIKQQYQELSGGARVQGGFLPLFDPHLEGERIRFVLVDEQHAHWFEGRVNGALMEGTVKSGIGNAQVENRWRATRIVPGDEDANR